MISAVSASVQVRVAFACDGYQVPMGFPRFQGFGRGSWEAVRASYGGDTRLHRTSRTSFGRASDCLDFYFNVQTDNNKKDKRARKLLRMFISMCLTRDCLLLLLLFIIANC